MRIIALTAALLMAGSAHGQAIVGQLSNSESNSNANSSSNSAAGAISDQSQGQSQNAVADQGQTQGQSSANTNNQSTTAQQGNQQATTLNFEASTIPTDVTTRWKGNTTVALAAGVSFSSDYCGGTASGGASGLGWSLGLAKPTMDGNCQALRRSEKFGVAAANAYNMGRAPLAGKLLAMQVWEICMAGNDADVSRTAEACQRLALIGEGDLPHEQPAHEEGPINPPAAPPTPDMHPHNGRTIIRGSDGKEVEYPEARVPRG